MILLAFLGLIFRGRFDISVIPTRRAIAESL